MPVMEQGSSQLYMGDGYELMLDVLDAGDLSETVLSMCGYEKDNMTMVQTRQNGMVRYDFVWTAAGEEGLQVGRASIYDDGNYHYVLTALAAEEAAGELRQEFQEIFASCKLLDPDVNLSTGS